MRLQRGDAECHATDDVPVEWDGKPERHFDAKAREKNAPRNGVMAAWKATLLLDAFLALIGRLQVFAGLFLSALRIVFGADRQVVFVDRAFSLPGDIEDLA